MDNNQISDALSRTSLNAMLQDALDILEADDGKSFEEKRDAVISQLKQKDGSELARLLVERAIADKAGAGTKAAFWKCGRIIRVNNNVVLRPVMPCDHDGFLLIQQENSMIRSMVKEEAFCDMVWKEHNEEKSLMLSIENMGSYIGYCGIKDTSQDLCEIAIELKRDWTKHGIGYPALSTMLNAIKSRLGVTEFRVRIDPTNYPSQKLFERLGAIPNGLSELWLHDQRALEKFEEENLHLIDDRIVEVAKKFQVEPQKLLSHVLEYRLSWTEKGEADGQV